TNVVLRFWAKEFNEEPDGPPPIPFTDAANFDGVAISADGVTWYEVQGLRTLGEFYSDVVVDLDAAIERFGLAYNSGFRLRFNQYGNHALTSDGIALDDIEITGQAPRRLSLTLPASATEGQDVLQRGGMVSLPTPVATRLLVTLTSSATSEVTFLAPVAIPAGKSSGSFDLTIQDDLLLDGSQLAIITASAPGYFSARNSITVKDNETAA